MNIIYKKIFIKEEINLYRSGLVYSELLSWRDFEIESGNMNKAKKIHKISKKYRYCF